MAALSILDLVRAHPSRSSTNLLFMKLGFIRPSIPGHLSPMTALARQLQARNSEVVFLYSRGGAGLPFVPGDKKDQLPAKCDIQRG
jgi:hypothetical protein